MSYNRFCHHSHPSHEIARDQKTSCEVYDSFMFAICFNVVVPIPSLHRKCIITEPKPSINENKEIKDIQSSPINNCNHEINNC